MPSVSAASWLAVQTEVMVGLPDPKLRLKLAMSFQEVERLERLNQRLVDYTIGLQSALSKSAQPVRDLLRKSVKEQAATLAQRGENLIAELDLSSVSGPDQALENGIDPSVVRPRPARCTRTD